MKDKFVKKYMRIAKLVAEDQNPCYSRKVGVVLVDPIGNRILGTGYNGPPRGTPHCDSKSYLESFVWPQLTEEDKNLINCDNMLQFSNAYENCKKCPRRILNIPSGKRLELCSCEHGEKNAIVNAAQNLNGAYAFCWCGVPCVECTKLLINSGIKKVYCLEQEKYSHGSDWLFQQAGVDLVILLENWILEN